MESGADFSTNSRESFARWDQESLCWKTWQRCLLEEWETYSGRWPRSGTMRSGIAYRLQPLVPRISGTGYLFTPTTKGNQAAPSMMKHPGCRKAFLPTPNTMDSMGPLSAEALARAKKRGGCSNLKDQVSGQLNPLWVEWLMGFPLGWTELEGSETQ